MIRTRFFAWEEPRPLASRIRTWSTSGQEVRDVDAIAPTSPPAGTRRCWS